MNKSLLLACFLAAVALAARGPQDKKASPSQPTSGQALAPAPTTK